MVEGNLDTIIDNPAEVIQQLQKADHFYICHYSKKREQIEHRRCFGIASLKFGKPKMVS